MSKPIRVVIVEEHPVWFIRWPRLGLAVVLGGAILLALAPR